MKTERIRKGLYRTKNGYMIQLRQGKWEVWNEVTGTVYTIEDSKKRAVDYCKY